MPILNSIQRRSISGRLILGAFYGVLVFGAIWMVYPFLMMLGGSVKTEVDYRQADLIPRFLVSEEMLFRKFEEQRYGRIDLAMATTRARDERGGRLYSFENFRAPKSGNGQPLQDWREFLSEHRRDFPNHYFALGHLYGPRSMPEVLFRYQKMLREAFPDIATRDLRFSLSPEDWPSRNYQAPRGERGEVYERMRAEFPDRYFYPVSLDGNFALNAVALTYGDGQDGLERLNREWGTNYASVLDVPLARTLPENPAERAVWEPYVRNFLSPRFLKVDPQLLPAYRGFLRQKYGEIAEVNAAYSETYSDWASITLPQAEAAPAAVNDLGLFVQGLPSLEGVAVESVETRWRDFLRGKYGTVAALNKAWGLHDLSFENARIPALEYDWQILRENKLSILGDFLTRNYRAAWDQVVLNGNALRNTIIFCLLNVLTALIVNPLAAYALSRFQPGWGQVALFVLMATMAFPAEVTQIPAFLLLRELGWLNTFAALVIPAAANGYSIFLLKGFFDSLPKELYEAATIDGSGELRAFFTITLPLSAPILAVVALGAFAAAYGAFMFALLVCQKESMWTLMVYIYQLQQNYNPPIVFAALVIAAIPTLVIFVLCQNVIMKGIVVPVEK
jgi:ABC-type glycerol-3-phosphate transport system permease component